MACERCLYNQYIGFVTVTKTLSLCLLLQVPVVSCVVPCAVLEVSAVAPLLDITAAVSWNCLCYQTARFANLPCFVCLRTDAGYAVCTLWRCKTFLYACSLSQDGSKAPAEDLHALLQARRCVCWSFQHRSMRFYTRIAGPLRGNPLLHPGRMQQVVAQLPNKNAPALQGQSRQPWVAARTCMCMHAVAAGRLQPDLTRKQPAAAPNTSCSGASAWSRGAGIRCHATQDGSHSGSSTIFTLPTILTIARVLAIPFLIAAWYTPAPWSSTAVTATFIAASITDWLDGYLARKMKLSSAFGAFLDPVADKLMVAAVLILLSTQPIAAGPLTGDTLLMPICTLAIIGREISMSALREWAASLGGEARNAVAVSWMGKWKTATQMISLTLLLMVRDGPIEGWLGVVAGWGGPGLLLVATALTLLSLADYTRALWRYLV